MARAMALFFTLTFTWLLPVLAHAQESARLQEAINRHVAGEADKARQAYEDALAQSPPLSARDEATATNNLCVLLPELGEHASAVEPCRRAVELRRAAEDPVRLARSLNNLGIALLYTGRPEDAGRAFEEALKLNRSHRQAAAEADNLTHLGLVAEAQGRHSDAIDFHLRSQTVAEAHSEAPWSEERRRTSVINRGVPLERLGQFRTALELYDELLHAPDLKPRQRARLLLNTAVLYRNLGDPRRAVDTLLEADRLFLELGDLTGRVDVSLNLGRANDLDLGRPKAAEAAYRQALDDARRAGDRFGEVHALYLLGGLLKAGSKPEDAREPFELCLRFSSADRWPEASWSARAGLAELALITGDTAEALEHIEAALKVVEAVRDRVRSPRQRGSFFRDRRSIYSTALEIYFRHGRSTNEPDRWARTAFELAQRAKDRELAEALKPRPAGPTSPKNFKSRAFLHRLADRGFVEYWTADPWLYRWTLPPEAGGHGDLGALGFERIEAHDLDHLVLQAVTGIDDGGFPAKDVSERLATILLPGPGPGADLRGSWLVAPDGVLKRLPFDLLPIGSDRLWVDAARLQYVPSASVIAELPGARNEFPLSFVGLADPEISPAGARHLRGRSGDGARLQPLPAARREQESAARRLGGNSRLAVGREADETFLRRAWRERPRILHLAAHAWVAPHGEGALLLAGREGSAEADGLLRPEEIAELDGSPQLVVTAACRSALGDDRELGSLGTLTGAFLAAGAAGVVASLWPVGDQATEVFMDRFYARLAAGDRPDVALAQVKRLMRADPRWNQPRYWAPWVLWGDPPAVAPKPLPKLALAGLAMLLVALGIVFRHRRYR